MTNGFWHNTARICNLCLRSHINNKRKLKCKACKEQNAKKINYKGSREIKIYISTLETRGANETNYIKRVFKTRYFLKHPSEP